MIEKEEAGETEKYIGYEKECHGDTWAWLQAYVEKNGKLPEEDEFWGKIVADELADDPEAYEDEEEEKGDKPEEVDPEDEDGSNASKFMKKAFKAGFEEEA